MPRRSKRQEQLEEARESKRKVPQREEDDIDSLSTLPGPSTSSQLVNLEMLPRRSKRLKQAAISRDQENIDDGNGR